MPMLLLVESMATHIRQQASLNSIASSLSGVWQGNSTTFSSPDSVGMLPHAPCAIVVFNKNTNVAIWTSQCLRAFNKSVWISLPSGRSVSV